MRPRASDPSWFRRVLGQYPTGVCAVTCGAPDGTPAGFVVGSFTSVSLNPPLIALFPDKSSTTWPQIETAGRFCVNVIAAEQEQLCRRLAAKDEGRFEGVSWRPASSGSPIIEGVVAWLDCDLHSVAEAGDHFVVLGRVRELDLERPTLPLLFFQGGYGRFEPHPLAAGERHSDLVAQLRQLELVRPEAEALASDLHARCIITTRRGDDLLVLGTAGTEDVRGAPTLVGECLPFSPPLGNAFAAWLADPDLDRYLATADQAAPRATRAQLVEVRRRGHSLGIHPLAESPSRIAPGLRASRRDSLTHDDLRGLTSNLTYDPVELSPELKPAIRSITVPVFDTAQRPILTFTLYGFPDPDENAAEEYTRRCMRAAQAASERVAEGGER